MDNLCYTLNKRLGEEKLGAFLDGELTDEESSAVAAHLESCGQCRDALAAMRSVGMLLREDAAKAADEADYSQLWEGVRSGTLLDKAAAAPGKGPETSWFERFFAGFRPLIAPMEGLAVALLVIGAVYFAATLRPPMARPSQPSLPDEMMANAAEIDSIETDSGAVMVVQSPDSGATIIILVETNDIPDEESNT